jgi:hypothetical protein
LDGRLSSLKSEAYRIGDELLKAGKTLQGQPQNIWIDSLSVNLGPARPEVLLNASCFDLQQIAKLTNEIRDVLAELEKLRQL